MTETTCKRCKGTGALRSAFYTAGKLCDCERGLELASWAALTPAQQAERADREAAARREAEGAARAARRAAREAAAR